MSQSSKKRSSWLSAASKGLGFLALCCFLYVGWQLVGTSLVSAPENHALLKKVEAEIPTMTGTPVPVVSGNSSSSPPATSAAAVSVVPGQPFGLVRIPRFGASYVQPLLESTDESTLQHGVGHYVGTALPCEIGNFSMAGHRTTYGAPFNKIAQLQPGDLVIIQTKALTCTYQVTSYEIVQPTAVQVIAPVPDHPGQAPVTAEMTMTSCTPMYSAAQRYIIHGKLVSQQTN